MRCWIMKGWSTATISHIQYLKSNMDGRHSSYFGHSSMYVGCQSIITTEYVIAICLSIIVKLTYFLF